MAPKKQVHFANTTGKPLISVREINQVGKSKKVVPAKRKYVPANLTRIPKKHENAVRHAETNVAMAIGKIYTLKREMNLEKNDEKAIRNEMAKQMKKKSLFGKKPNVEHFKNKLEESNKERKKIMRKMLNAKMELIMAQNKLAAQKAARL